PKSTLSKQQVAPLEISWLTPTSNSSFGNSPGTSQLCFGSRHPMGCSELMSALLTNKFGVEPVKVFTRIRNPGLRQFTRKIPHGFERQLPGRCRGNLMRNTALSNLIGQCAGYETLPFRSGMLPDKSAALWVSPKTLRRKRRLRSG